MSSLAGKCSTVHNVIARSYAVQVAAAAKQKSSSLPHQPQITKLPNGAVVASLENNSPVSSVSIFLKSGSRYETACNSGVSHLMRLCAGQATENFTAFGVTRRTQQLGGTLICQHGREHMSYGVHIIRDNLTDALQIVGDIATNPTFKTWEIAAQKVRLLSELSVREPTTITFDLLHKAAFRNTGLGNTLYMPDHHIGKITQDQLLKFFADTHTSQRMAVVGLGIDHGDLLKFAKGLDTSAGEGIAGTSSYGGGEVRQETGNALAYVAVAGPGAKIGSEDAASLAIAQSILGTGSGIKYGLNSSGKLASFISAAGGAGSAVAINVNYFDAGLFGFFVVEEASKAGDVVKSIAKGIRNLKISEADVQNAKIKAKSAILMGVESSCAELEDMGLQTLLYGKYSEASDYVASIDKVTAASVQSALANMLKGKACMSAYGGISNVPYVDQL